jgi:hypothetical protein
VGSIGSIHDTLVDDGSLSSLLHLPLLLLLSLVISKWLTASHQEQN